MPSARTRQDAKRIAIIDIGSNSVRLVVYEGDAPAPTVLFNEKVMAGLGRSLADGGMLDVAASERALAALGRFKAILAEMEVETIRTVATAAVRDAGNGATFLEAVGGLGLAVELLSGEEEAVMAAWGVIAGIPGANGIVGDLGGGSLELARVEGGTIAARASFPLGTLRLPAIRNRSPRALDTAVGAMLRKGGWGGEPGLPLYLVGGSWRALARLDMHLTGYPLPIVHHYRMAPGRPTQLLRRLPTLRKTLLKEVPSLSGSRVPSLAPAAALLAVLARRLGSSELIVSAFGLREGILHRARSGGAPPEDPLIAAVRAEGARQGRFAEHGDLLDRWIAPLFTAEPAEEARLRRAACLLSDTGWRAHPEFRAERGLETAIQGNWVGIDARGRAMIGQALYASFGGKGAPGVVKALCQPAEIARAVAWGLALRLSQRLSGGAAAALESSRVARRDGTLVLELAPDIADLFGEAVERRHAALASALQLKPALVIGGGA